MKKRLSAIILALGLGLMLLSLTAPAMAADSNFVIIKDDSGSVSLVGYNGPGGDVVVPDGVTDTYDTFRDRSDITSVTFPSSVTGIWANTFYDCTGLKNVVIPSSVTLIGAQTFYGCTNLKSIFIPSSVTWVGWEAFQGCTNLTDIYFGGTQEQWAHFDEQNSDLRLPSILGEGVNPTIHYNSTDPNATTTLTTPAFTDVPAGQWYADAVNWAVENEITNGTGNGKFSPGQDCTQEQILTFLYRAARGGSTAASADDMAAAVSWAREKGMIDDSFDGKALCTRSTAVSYIWQALGKEAAEASSFTDVSADAAYAKAVDWAVANGITNGDGSETVFSPDKVCSRGHIVTFLHRAYVPSARLK